MGEVIVLNEHRSDEELKRIEDHEFIESCDKFLALNEKIQAGRRRSKCDEGPDAIFDAKMTRRTAAQWRERLVNFAGHLSIDHPVWRALFPIIDALGYKAGTPGYAQREPEPGRVTRNSPIEKRRA